ncbi:MAG: hypothetical protein Kow00109_00840 [Acidobacteriota bacterium]
MHAWEDHLSRRDRRRRVLPFSWGLEWLSLADVSGGEQALRTLLAWADRALGHSDELFAVSPGGPFRREGRSVLFPTPLPSGYPANDTARCRVWGSLSPGGEERRAVIVVPQWNADSGSHVGLCRLLARLGMTAVRLTPPYHEERKVDGLERAEYMVSANVGRTLHAVRQAVLEVRVVADWLQGLGFGRIGIVGTSLGSCVAYLAFAHEPRLTAGVFNHVAAHFADVVWFGQATRYVRRGLEPFISLSDLRRCWAVLSPWHYIPRVCHSGRPHTLITAAYDGTFLPELAEAVFARYRDCGCDPDVRRLPCGHYTTARFPFKYLDGWHIATSLRRNLACPAPRTSSAHLRLGS